MADVHTPRIQDKCDSQQLQQYPLSIDRSSYRVYRPVIGGQDDGTVASSTD